MLTKSIILLFPQLGNGLKEVVLNIKAIGDLSRPVPAFHSPEHRHSASFCVWYMHQLCMVPSPTLNYNCMFVNLQRYITVFSSLGCIWWNTFINIYMNYAFQLRFSWMQRHFFGEGCMGICHHRLQFSVSINKADILRIILSRRFVII